MTVMALEHIKCDLILILHREYQQTEFSAALCKSCSQFRRHKVLFGKYWTGDCVFRVFSRAVNEISWKFSQNSKKAHIAG